MRVKPNGERLNFPKQCKPVKTPSSKTQQDIHTKSVFDELELSMEINQALNPHMDKRQQVFQSKTIFEGLGLVIKITTNTKTQHGEKPNKN